MTTVLVTGAGGALGRALCRHLDEQADCRVVRCGRHAGDGDLALDVTDERRVAEVVAMYQPARIFHLAATFEDDFELACRVNVYAARYLFEAVNTLERPCRVLVAGSAAEYGVVSPAENPVAESRVLNPVSIYGLTKAWQTQLAGYYAGQGVDVVTARIFNLDGEGLSERLFAGRVKKQIEAVLSGRQPRIELGPLNAQRDYVSLDEAVRQILLIADRGVSGRIYHVASGEAVDMKTLLEGYLAAAGLDMSIVDHGEANRYRAGYDVPVIFADMQRTRALERLDQ